MKTIRYDSSTSCIIIIIIIIIIQIWILQLWGQEAN